MKNIITIISVALVLLPIGSCYYPIEPTVLIDHYPVKAGNRWSYTRTFSLHNFRPLHPGVSYQETSYVFQSTVEALGREVLQDTLHTWKFRTTETGGLNLQPVVGYNFYRQTRDALLSVAYKNPDLVAPLQKSHVQYHYAGQSFETIAELLSSIEGNPHAVFGLSSDSLTYETVPATAFAFPIGVGREWDYRMPLPPLNWRIHKKVVGTTILHLPAGDFSSDKIQWFWDTRNNGTWDPKISGFDYLSSRGLVKREFLLKDIVVSTPVYPDSAGLVDVKDEYSAISVTVHE